jgi:hypothetical protein
MLAAYLRRLRPRLLLPQVHDDLLLAEPAALHRPSASGSDPTQIWRSFRGSGHRPKPPASSRSRSRRSTDPLPRHGSLAGRGFLPVTAFSFARPFFGKSPRQEQAPSRATQKSTIERAKRTRSPSGSARTEWTGGRAGGRPLPLKPSAHGVQRHTSLRTPSPLIPLPEPWQSAIFAEGFRLFVRASLAVAPM